MPHLGVIKTTARVMMNWYWPGMTADIRRFVLGCQICQQSKIAKTKTAGERQHLFRGDHGNMPSYSRKCATYGELKKPALRHIDPRRTPSPKGLIKLWYLPSVHS